MSDTLENIIDEIVLHEEEHPDHGLGCFCHDKHAAVIRRLIKGRWMGKNERERAKSLNNLFIVFGHVIKNP